ncbi:hypothetical protein [Haloprofundus halobius]|uniref:hypothetical protein n=1 Tax=Haloprofundus halobius TaxID=2876194 RepID=UPI001CCDD18A|nr:hypothetical protein [Haloprofundus halobius]
MVRRRLVALLELAFSALLLLFERWFREEATRRGNPVPSPPAIVSSTLFDLLPRLKTRESHHGIRAADALRSQPALGGNRRHTGGTLV